MVGKSAWLVLTDPDRFMRTRVSESPLWQPTLLVVFNGLLAGVPALLMVSRLDVGNGIQQTVLQIGQSLGLVVGLLTALAVWLVSTAVVHGLSGLLGASEGEFRETFRAVGWGYIPVLFGSALNLAITWHVVQRAPATVSVSEMQSIIQGSQLVQLGAFISATFLVWKGSIWIFGIHRVRGISLRKAVLAASVPIVLQLAWSIHNLI